MSDEPECQTNAEPHVGRWVLWVVAALVFYVLSSGPMLAVSHKAYGTNKEPAAYAVMYAPLIYSTDKWPAADRVMRLYIDWWFKLCGEKT